MNSAQHLENMPFCSRRGLLALEGVPGSSASRSRPPTRVGAEGCCWTAGRVRVEPVGEPGRGFRATPFVAPVFGRRGDVEPVQFRPCEGAGRGFHGGDVQLLEQHTIGGVALDPPGPEDRYPEVTGGVYCQPVWTNTV